MGLTAIVLGAAAGGGFPQWNCNCAVCRLAWAGDPRVRASTQASLAVSADGTHWTLLNASPDLRAQIQAVGTLHPQGGQRGSPILPGEKFTLGGGLQASLFMVPGKLPLYLEGEDPETAAESAINVGVEITNGSKRLAYVPGAASVTPALRERLARTDVILFDGTLNTDDEMIRTGTGTKTGRRMGHMPIDGPDGSLAALEGLPARKIFVHINNTNPILVESSPERRRAEAAGWEVAWDGMEIVL